MSAAFLRRLARAAAGLACLSAFAVPVSAADLTPFKVGEASPANTFLAIWMAEAAGLYEAQGLKLEIVHMVGGKDSGPALRDQSIHLMHIGMSSAIRANLAKIGNMRGI